VATLGDAMAETPPMIDDQDWLDTLTPEQREQAVDEGVRCLNQAITESDTACVWLKDYCLKPDISNLGQKVSRTYRQIYSRYQQSVYVSRLAIGCFWIAQRKNELWWTANVEAGRISQEEGKKYAEVFEASCAGNKGWAFFCSLLDMEEREFLKDAFTSLHIDVADILLAIGLHWFCQADESMKAGNISAAIDQLSDAFNALQHGWGYKVSDIGRESARRGADIRHIKTHAKRKEVINYWREHIHPSHPRLSSEKAGEWLHDSFPELSVRKLSEYVAQAKRETKDIPSEEIPSAGKA
jgi:hypothetical protein